MNTTTKVVLGATGIVAVCGLASVGLGATLAIIDVEMKEKKAKKAKDAKANTRGPAPERIKSHRVRIKVNKQFDDIVNKY